MGGDAGLFFRHDEIEALLGIPDEHTGARDEPVVRVGGENVVVLF